MRINRTLNSTIYRANVRLKRSSPLKVFIDSAKTLFARVSSRAIETPIMFLLRFLYLFSIIKPLIEVPVPTVINM